MFPLNVYSEAFKNVHGRFLKLTSEQILDALKKGTGKVNNKASSLLKKHKAKYKIDKVKIAYELLRIIGQAEKLDDVLIKNFERLFDELHKIIDLYER